MPTPALDRRLVLLMELLRTSALLQRVLPDLRRSALYETLRRCESYEAAKQIALENMAGSPYVPDDQKNILGELVLLEQWDTLRKTLQSDADPHVDARSEFQMFLRMVVQTFSRSRKIRALPEARRHQLGLAIHGTSTVEELKELAMHSLETSVTLSAHDCQQIANDLWDDRYDLLLLPDRFDCDEKPRQSGIVQTEGQQESDSDDECPICLGVHVVDRRLQCGHAMCHTCLEQWAIRREGSQFTCPMCRAPSCPSTAQAL